MNRTAHFREYGRQLYRRLERSWWMAQARRYVGNPDRVLMMLSLLPRFMNRRAFRPVLRDLLLLYYYARDVMRRDYVDYRPKKLLIVVAVLLYVVSPLDFVPDWVPMAGLLDDAALVSYAVGVLDDELMRYYKWVKRKRSSAKRD